MTDGERTYTDEEFALVLKKATEMAKGSGGATGRGAEFTLDDMKAIASEAGLDPARVERAARMVPQEPSGPYLRRWFGRRRLAASFPVPLNQDRSSHVLSVIKATTEWNAGEATPSGLVWGALSTSVTAHNDGSGSRFQVTWSPAVARVVTAMIAGASIFIASINAGSLLGFVVMVGLGLGLATTIWASMAKRGKRRVDQLMDVVSRAMADLMEEPDNQGAPPDEGGED
jgi:hypothetical protein